MEQLARLLDEMGPLSSLNSHSNSFELWRSKMIRTAQCLRIAFTVDVTSRDMALLNEAPDTVSNEARITNELGSDSASGPGGDRIVG